MAVQYKIGNRYSNNRNEVMLHETEELSIEAKFTWDLVKQLGIVACVFDGEDTSGRQKLRLLEPSEVVDRATEIARLTFDSFRSKGWVTNLPDVSEIWPDVEDKD